MDVRLGPAQVAGTSECDPRLFRSCCVYIGVTGLGIALAVVQACLIGCFVASSEAGPALPSPSGVDDGDVTESARACSYYSYSSKQVQKTSPFWLLTCRLLTFGC